VTDILYPVVTATRALLARPLPNGTAPDVPDFKNVAPFYLNETFPENWYRIPNSYSAVDLLGDIATLFLFKPQPLGTNYNGQFVPSNLTLPTAPAALGCLAFSLLASAAPGQVAAEVTAANAVREQLLAPVFSSAGCDLTDYSNDPPTNAPLTGEDANAGSGSGITHFGEYDSQTTVPTGESAGDQL